MKKKQKLSKLQRERLWKILDIFGCDLHEPDVCSICEKAEEIVLLGRKK